MPDRSDLLERVRTRCARVGFVGQGYVGLPLALRACEVGFAVVGYEVDPRRVQSLQHGHSYVGDVSDTELAGAIGRGYRAVSDPAELAGFDVVVITVPTPLRDGKPDLGYIESATRAVAEHLRPGAAVILESTTYPGTTEEFVAGLIRDVTGLVAGDDYVLGYSPERVDPGNRTWNIVNTPKIVSGVDADSLAVVDAFYSALVDTTVAVGSCAEAEMAKLLENTFRHVNIALVNELAVFAHQLGVDIWRVIDAASTKPFGFMRFTPGPGVGGHCLPVDPSYLAWRIETELGESFRFVELANQVNSSMPDYVIHRLSALLARHGKSLAGAQILLLGLSFKKGTSDCRESPSIVVAERALAAGAIVRAVDPHVDAVNVPTSLLPLVPLSSAQLEAADIVVVLVDHDEFDPALIARSAPLVLDTKGLLRSERIRGEIL